GIHLQQSICNQPGEVTRMRMIATLPVDRSMSMNKSQRMPRFSWRVAAMLLLLCCAWGAAEVRAELKAGVAKVDITNDEAGPANDRLYAKALVLSDGTTTAAIVTVDAVAIGEIGPIKNDYLGKVRSRLEQE